MAQARRASPLQSLPPGYPARRAATALVDAVVRRGRPLDDLLDEPDGPLVGLDTRDRALARAIAGTTLRRLGVLRAALGRFLRKPLPEASGHLEAILLTAAAQILLMEVPDHASVALAVAQAREGRQTRGFAPLANAILRNLVRAEGEIVEMLDGQALADVPAWLAERWILHHGAEAAAAIAVAQRVEPALDLTVKTDPAGWAERLGGVLLPTGTVRLAEHGGVADLSGFADGAWWVQDAAASLPARLLDARPGERVADLCAAPGGKTAQLAAVGARVTAVDRSGPRLRRLTENLARLGLAAETVTADATEWEAEPFDAVLLDAPCSATGTIRRHPDVAWLKKPGDIQALAPLQARLLERAAALVRPGGRLVYATCSLEPEEGEAQVAALLERRPDFARNPIAAREVAGRSELLTEKGELRTLPLHFPHPEPRLAGLDGFYAARLVRASRA